ncbi:MAG: hypothetical protein WC650_02910 [Candidatus Doudnabacteria bacterium]
MVEVKNGLGYGSIVPDGQIVFFRDERKGPFTQGAELFWPEEKIVLHDLLEKEKDKQSEPKKRVKNKLKIICVIPLDSEVWSILSASDLAENKTGWQDLFLAVLQAGVIFGIDKAIGFYGRHVSEERYQLGDTVREEDIVFLVSDIDGNEVQILLPNQSIPKENWSIASSVIIPERAIELFQNNIGLPISQLLLLILQIGENFGFGEQCILNSYFRANNPVLGLGF